MKKTSCERCIAISKSSGNQCRNMTCKYSPYCYVHRVVNVKQSSIPNSGLGVYAKEDLKKDKLVGRYTVGTQRLTMNELPPLNQRTHIWKKNNNLFYDASKTNSVAGKFNDCTPHSAKRIKCKNNALINSVGNVRLKSNVKKNQEIFVSYGKDYWKNK